jgi:hypothetical protein
MLSNRTVKKVHIPAIYNSKNWSYFDGYDINVLFWNELFSKKVVNEILNLYLERSNPDSNVVCSLNYLYEEIDSINRLVKETARFNISESFVWFYFKMYNFYLEVINTLFLDTSISLAYGVRIIREIEDENIASNYLLNIIRNLVSDSFFSDNTDYHFYFHYDFDLALINFIAKIIKQRYKNVSVFITTELCDELSDYNTLKKGDIYEYIDDVIQHNDNYETSYGYRNQIGLLNKEIHIRLFNSPCYWRKCTFCTINNKYPRNAKKVLRSNLYVRNRIQHLLDDIALHNVTYVAFSDEAISLPVLLYFAKRIQQHKLKIHWSVRARLDKRITFKNAKKLAASGLIEIAFGLESVNKRINKLMMKRKKHLSENDIHNILHNLSECGIAQHLYYIIGFPSETKAEANETLTFIHEAFNRYKDFSFTSNIFSLMKKSYIELNPDKFSIVITDSNNSCISGIQYYDNTCGDKYTRDEVIDIHKQFSSMFFYENVDSAQKKEQGYKYMTYLMKSGLFFYLKSLNKSAHFYEFRNNKKIEAINLYRCYYLIRPVLNRDFCVTNPITGTGIKIIDETEYQDIVRFIKEFSENDSLLLNLVAVKGAEYNKSTLFHTPIYQFILFLYNENMLIQKNLTTMKK